MSIDRNAPWTVERAQRELPADTLWEIDEGQLVMREPPSFYHGHAVTRIAARLHAFVEAAGTGLLSVGDPGFRLARNPDTLRTPDIAFLGRARLAALADLHGFPPGAQDLAEVVLSPSNRRREVSRRVAQFLARGGRAVWVVDPERRRLERHGADGVQVYAGDAAVVEEPVLPGFRCTLGELLPPASLGR